MCGIVGLFLKDPKLEPKLGAMLTDMLITMTDRGPDSAGIAIYSGGKDGLGKITVQSADPTKDFKDLDGDLHDAIGQPVTMLVKSTHAVLEVPLDQMEAARSALSTEWMPYQSGGWGFCNGSNSIGIFSKEKKSPRKLSVLLVSPWMISSRPSA